MQENSGIFKMAILVKIIYKTSNDDSIQYFRKQPLPEPWRSLEVEVIEGERTVSMRKRRLEKGHVERKSVRKRK